MEESIILDLIRLVTLGMITTAEILDATYKAEVESRLAT